MFHNPSILFQPFGYIMMFVIFNLIFRTLCIMYIKKGGNNIKKIMIIDFTILSIVILLFFVYEIIFILNQY